MLPIVAVTGIPQYTIVKLHPDYRYDGDPSIWDVRFLHAQSHKVGFKSCWRSVKELLVNVESSPNSEGLHILAFQKSDDTMRAYAERIQPFHRLRLLDRAVLGAYGDASFTEYLDAVLAEELAWRRDIRPDDRNHPLLLPENSFVPSDGLSKMWDKARAANSKRDCASVKTMIAGMASLRKEVDAYHDIAGFRFRYTGSHGAPTADEFNWKMSFRFPDRMHYDVNRVDNKEPFNWNAGDGVRRFATHANVTPHGILV